MPSKWRRIVVVCLCLIVLLTIFLISETWRLRGDTPTDTAREQPYRIIGIWEGRVAVYRPQTDTPETVYDTAVSSLPAEEQQKLREGVAVTDSATLAQRLEDYIS